MSAAGSTAVRDENARRCHPAASDFARHWRSPCAPPRAPNPAIRRRARTRFQRAEYRGWEQVTRGTQCLGSATAASFRSSKIPLFVRCERGKLRTRALAAPAGDVIFEPIAAARSGAQPTACRATDHRLDKIRQAIGSLRACAAFLRYNLAWRRINIDISWPSGIAPSARAFRRDSEPCHRRVSSGATVNRAQASSAAAVILHSTTAG